VEKVYVLKEGHLQTTDVYLFQVDRSRYLARITELSRAPSTLKLLEGSEIREQQLKWPTYFEITQRLGQVHEEILLSSQVFSPIRPSSKSSLTVIRD
jgi:hypothetical protein